VAVAEGDDARAVVAADKAGIANFGLAEARLNWEVIEKTNPSPGGERGLGSKAVRLGFAIQATETEKGDGAQPEQGG
jgi:hypothetical protein